jgi:predicted regulator of Ras-like GTPase activity (Roadblock/LC7/MglB family)
MSASNGRLTPVELNKLLDEMNAGAGFPLAVVTNHDGYVIAASGPEGVDAQRQSAVVAKVGETAALASSQLKMGALDEVSIYSLDGSRLICRSVGLPGSDLILSVMISKRGQSYRRATSKVIAQLRENWGN